MKCVLLFTVLAACDPIAAVTINITVPAAAQSPMPAALHIRVGEETGSLQLFGMCAQQFSDITTAYEESDTVCPTRQDVQVWLAPLATAPADCTIPARVCRTNEDPTCRMATRTTDDAPPAGAPFGHLVIFDRDGCSDHDETHAVTLQL